MTYSIKEIFLTLQGEGARSGRTAVFCRFSGCNLWSGLERDRSNAICQFCDTDFVGTDGLNGGKYKNEEELLNKIDEVWAQPNLERKYIILTGGEPLLQVNRALIDKLHERSYEIGIETNGTLSPPEGIDWICVSPKANAQLTLKTGHELKLIYPQTGLDPEKFESLSFDNFYLQPMDNENREENVQKSIEYCTTHPRWQLSLQTHKLIGIP